MLPRQTEPETPPWATERLQGEPAYRELQGKMGCSISTEAGAKEGAGSMEAGAKAGAKKKAGSKASTHVTHVCPHASSHQIGDHIA